MSFCRHRVRRPLRRQLELQSCAAAAPQQCPLAARCSTSPCRTPDRLASFVSEEAECSAATAEALRVFWDSNRLRCRTALVQRAAWGETPLRVAWRVEIEAGASQSLRKQAGEASDAAGGDAAADAGGDGEGEGEATASVEITLAGRAAPGQRAGEGAQARGALSFKASRDALVMLRDRLAEAEASAAAMC